MRRVVAACIGIVCVVARAASAFVAWPSTSAPRHTEGDAHIQLRRRRSSTGTRTSLVGRRRRRPPLSAVAAFDPKIFKPHKPSPDGAWRDRLLADPAVTVAPSTVRGAGDGLFASRDIAAGTALTWIDFAYGSIEDLRYDPYRDNYFDFWATEGCYSRADGSKKRPRFDGCGHVVNDGSTIRALPLDAMSCVAPSINDVATYVEKSLAAENVVIFDGGDDGLYAGAPDQVVHAMVDLREGTELFRSYAPRYWLQHCEATLDVAMHVARCELRLLGALVGDARLVQAAEIFFETARARLATLDAEYHEDFVTCNRVDNYGRAYEPWRPRFSAAIRSFNDGFSIYEWLDMDLALRRAYVAELGLFDNPTLLLSQANCDALNQMLAPPSSSNVDDDDDDVFIKSSSSSSSSSSSPAPFRDLFLSRCSPPFGGAHYDAFLAARRRREQQSGGLAYDETFPW